MAVEVKHAIRTANAWTANQAAMELIYGVGGYYTSISAWEAAQQRDLVAADEVAIAECYNDWPAGLTETVSVTGWTTDATRYVIIRSPDSDRHTGIKQSGFRLYGSANTSILNLLQAYTQAIGLEVQKSTSHTSGYVVFIEDKCKAAQCIIHGQSSSSSVVKFGAGAGSNLSLAPILENSLIIGAGTAVTSNSGGGTQAAIVRNCTIKAGTTGIYSKNSEVVAQNNIIASATTSYSGAFHANSSHNAAFNASLVTPPGASPL